MPSRSFPVAKLLGSPAHIFRYLLGICQPEQVILPGQLACTGTPEVVLLSGKLCANTLPEPHPEQLFQITGPPNGLLRLKLPYEDEQSLSDISFPNDIQEYKMQNIRMLWLQSRQYEQSLWSAMTKKRTLAMKRCPGLQHSEIA